jgi:hypothetical protein
VSSLFFPDNTVLVNFALMSREDLLISLLGGRAHWTVTIAGECRRSSMEPGLEGMAVYIEAFNEPLIPSPAERTDTRLYRDRLAIAGDPETRHLGEAETIAVVTSRGLPAIFVTDDGGARRLASAAGVSTATTINLLRIAVRAGRLSPDAVMALFALLAERGRHLVGAPPTVEHVRAWLE